MILLAFPDNVLESRRLSMLEGSFCPRSSPRPVKGRSQSLGHAASELELPQPPLLQAFQPTQSRGWAAQGHQMLTCCTSINLIALYYISLLSSPLRQAANMQAFSPFPSERHYLYFHFHTFHTIFITFPTTSMGSYHPSPLHSSNSTLITVTSYNPFKNLKHFCKLKHHFPLCVLWGMPPPCR